MKSLLIFAAAAVAFAQNPQTAAFPLSAVTDATILVASNNASTSTAGALTSGSTTIPVVSTAGFAVPAEVIIESEAIIVDTKTSNSFHVLARGADNTVPASHASGVLITNNIAALYHNQVAAEIKSVEKQYVNDFRSPYMYGAKGDGVTDDTTAVSNWISSIINQLTPVTGFCGQGTFKITSSISKNISTITGGAFIPGAVFMSPGGCTFMNSIATAGADLLTFIEAPGGTPGGGGAGSEKFQMRGFQFLQDPTLNLTSGTMLSLKGMSGFALENIICDGQISGLGTANTTGVYYGCIAATTITPFTGYGAQQGFISGGMQRNCQVCTYLSRGAAVTVQNVNITARGAATNGPNNFAPTGIYVNGTDAYISGGQIGSSLACASDPCSTNTIGIGFFNASSGFVKNVHLETNLVSVSVGPGLANCGNGICASHAFISDNEMLGLSYFSAGANKYLGTDVLVRGTYSQAVIVSNDITATLDFGAGTGPNQLYNNVINTNTPQVIDTPGNLQQYANNSRSGGAAIGGIGMVSRNADQIQAPLFSESATSGCYIAGAAGVGATCSTVGSAGAFQLTLNTGTSPATSSYLFSVTANTAYPNKVVPVCQLNSTGAAPTLFLDIVNAATFSGFTSVAFASNTTYRYNCIVKGY
jgi:hypothetical protein